MTSPSIMSPSQLLNRLLQSNFKQSECIDAKEMIKIQKRQLSQEVAALEQDLTSKKYFQIQLQKGISSRALLRVALEHQMRARKTIDTNSMCLVERAKLQPIEVRNISKKYQELEEVRQKCCAMSVRLRQLQEYATLLLQKIDLKYEESHIIEPKVQTNLPLGLPLTSLDEYCNLDWRQRVNAYKIEEQMHSKTFRTNTAANLQNKRYPTIN